MESYLGFLTVGTQLTFDRLVSYAERYSKEFCDTQFIYQVGEDGKCPECSMCHKFIDQNQFENIIEKVDFVVAHCGIGIIMTSAEYAKPIACCPRDSELREHRNDHQFDTADSLSNAIPVAKNYEEFVKCLDILKQNSKKFTNHSNDVVNHEFISELEKIILERV